MRHTEIFTGRVGQLKDIHELGSRNCVVNFSVAETPRVKKGDKWEDGTTIWTNVAIFGDEARNFHRSVKPGTHVIVIGTRQASEYTSNGESRTSQSIVAEQVGVAITKFDYVDTVGSVNYASGETGEATAKKSTKSASKAPAAKKDDVNPFSSTASEDVFADDSDDPFGLANS